MTTIYSKTGTDSAISEAVAALSSTYAAGVNLPDANGTNDTTAIQAVLTAAAGNRIIGKRGASYKISATLVIASGTTLDMTGCTITLLPGSNCRMIQNAAYGGAGARDTDIRIVGGYWDRGAVGGTLPNDQHSIVIHRADRVAVTDITLNATGAVKYSVYFCDVTYATAERCSLTSTSDGVHFTGPASNLVARDISGSTDDDMVSVTGRDYPNYELTAGGGSITNVLIENVVQRGTSSTNGVKLVPGASKVLDTVTVRKVTIGAAAGVGVSIMSDSDQASTTGGTVRNVTIDGVLSSAIGAVDVSHPDVSGLHLSNIAMTASNLGRCIGFMASGTVVKDVTIDVVNTPTGYNQPVIHVATGATVTSLKVSNVNAALATGGGYLLMISGAIGHVQMDKITLTGDGWLGYGESQGSCPLISINGLHAALTTGKGFVWYGTTDMELEAMNVTAVPTNGYIVDNYSVNSTVTLKAQNVAGTATSHLHKAGSNTPKIRGVGPSVRADVSLLTPVAGDIVYNTNAGLGCGAGVVISNGTLWKHLYSGATT